ncbi:hypothetical protein [Streptomyces noursei]|uniref:hypothetical protein n=1 Tax=Streptomyces noursei TaxID=1971 RepID=UPI001962522F|nr:hypothetical protein [Streptomyces noursei]QRX90853.1 hypothetical protein JNO44_08440 [Streptomyces noursei]
MTNTTVHRSQWDDHTPNDRRISWRKITAPDARSGPLSTHPVMGGRGMEHTAPWWVDGTLYTDNARWLDHIRDQAQAADEAIVEEAAPDGPPDGHLTEVEAMRRYAERHGLTPARTPHLDTNGHPIHIRPY